jgi:hypothetical protein
MRANPRSWKPKRIRLTKPDCRMIRRGPAARCHAAYRPKRRPPALLRNDSETGSVIAI